MVDLQVILNEVLAKYKILRVSTKSIHLENGGASPHLPTSCTPEGVFEVLMKVALVLHWFSLRCPEALFSIWVLFHEHLRITGLPGKGGGHFFNSSLPLSPASLSSWAITTESSSLGTFGYH